MEFAELIGSLDSETCNRLRRALELGKWPDGRKLTRSQQELCMQAVIAFDYQHKDEEERVGFIDRGKNAEAFATGMQEKQLLWREFPGDLNDRGEESE